MIAVETGSSPSPVWASLDSLDSRKTEVKCGPEVTQSSLEDIQFELVYQQMTKYL